MSLPLAGLGSSLFKAPLLRAFRGRKPALAIVIALLAAACQPKAAETEAEHPAPAPRIVWAERVKVSDGLEVASFTGTIEARSDQPLAFRVSGKLIERTVDIGADVRAGDVIARLDTTDFQHSLRVAAAQVRAAEAEAERAFADLERERELKLKGHVSQAGFDVAKSKAEAARESLEAARERQALAQNELSYAELRADADGIVTSVAAEPGQIVLQGERIVNIARNGEREAEIAIPESRVDGVENAKAWVSLWAVPGERFAARLRELSPDAGAAARSFTGRFAISNLPEKVKLGMTATVHLMREGEEPSFVVPLSALWYRGEDAFVWRSVAARDAVEAVPVSVRRLEDAAALVEGPLQASDLVVSMGVHRLDEHLAVRVEERADQAPVKVGALR